LVQIGTNGCGEISVEEIITQTKNTYVLCSKDHEFKRCWGNRTTQYADIVCNWSSSSSNLTWYAGVCLLDGSYTWNEIEQKDTNQAGYSPSQPVD